MVGRCDVRGAGHGQRGDSWVRYAVEMEAHSLGSPPHAEEGCAILVFMLHEFSRMMPAITVQLSCEVVRL